MALVRIRDEFPILERRNYLNSCSLGALSRRAEAALHEFAARWHDQGAAAWYEHWWSLLADLRRRVEKMFAAPAGSVALLPTTSTCLSVIAESLDWSKRNRIVATELDFPTLLYQWRVRPGAELVVLESSDGVRVDLEQFERAVDERTLAVATSHAHGPHRLGRSGDRGRGGSAGDPGHEPRAGRTGGGRLPRRRVLVAHGGRPRIRVGNRGRPASVSGRRGSALGGKARRGGPPPRRGAGQPPLLQHRRRSGRLRGGAGGHAALELPRQDSNLRPDG